MSCKVMYTCDHCGKEVSPYIGKQWKAGFLTVGPNIEDIHACSFDHLTLALAKTFDIPLDASTLRLVTEKNDALNAARAAIVECDNMRAQIAEHEAHTRTFDQLKVELERSKARERDLEKRIAELTTLVTIDGKTPGEVLILAQHGLSERRQVSRELFEEAERCANAVLRAFGQPSQTAQTNAVDALRRVRHAMFPNPRGQTTDPEARHRMQIIDDEIAKLKAKPAQSPPDTSTESGLPDPVIAAITLPTKPTKPLRERLEDLASYWEKGAASSSMSEGYRQASKDCAKELREAIDDPR